MKLMHKIRETLRRSREMNAISDEHRRVGEERGSIPSTETYLTHTRG